MTKVLFFALIKNSFPPTLSASTLHSALVSSSLCIKFCCQDFSLNIQLKILDLYRDRLLFSSPKVSSFDEKQYSLLPPFLHDNLTHHWNSGPHSAKGNNHRFKKAPKELSITFLVYPSESEDQLQGMPDVLTLLFKAHSQNLLHL